MQRKFLRDTILCALPILIAAIVVFRAYQKYEAGEGGFKLGVDLVGGTILIYEVDQEREKERREISKGQSDAAYQGEKTSAALAEAIKRRIDPDDVKNIQVRPAGDSRIEVILPTGSHRKNVEGKKNVSSGEVEKIKRLIEDVGSLEFRIVANSFDDGAAFLAIEEKYSKDNLNGEELREVVEQFRSDAIAGKLPPPPVPPEGDKFRVKIGETPERDARYAWIELSPIARHEMGLLNKDGEFWKSIRGMSEEERNQAFSKLTDADRKRLEGRLWEVMEAARSRVPAASEALSDEEKLNLLRPKFVRHHNYLLFSRECRNSTLSAEEMEKRKKNAPDGIPVDYFILTRISDRVEVDGTHVTITATPGTDPSTFQPIIQFTFNSTGGQQFGVVTRNNLPDQEGKRARQLAIILNGKLISHPNIQSTISDRGQISGGFDQDYVNLIVQQLRSGALPATLKQKPVSENTIGPTLGADTITSGTRAIGMAYLSVLLFMLVYYRFAGFVACIALLANLLLTIGFMVAVDATFTLPGLAGLVLMLGMAVDANILIYERLREERDRGANLQMAIRNAYDRAFGTIIDTHLTSIFTAIVLYAVGNDQLRGFGISLAVGLLISLFTSLFMTHLLFDFWVKKNWLGNLRMMRMFTRPNIDFMKLRKVMFPITGALTVLGLGLFLLRGEKSLNVDFIGGTVYGGQLSREVTLTELRNRFSDEHQAQALRLVSDPVKLDEAGKDVYEVQYANDSVKRRIQLALGLEGATPQEKIENLKKRVSHLPDLSVEQNFLSSSSSDKSKFFTVRTTEKEPDLVQIIIDRLFYDEKEEGKSLLALTELNFEAVAGSKSEWILRFTDTQGNERYASEAFLRTLLEREFRAKLAAIDQDHLIVEPFQLVGDEEHVQDGRYSVMRLTLSRDLISKDFASLNTKELLEKVKSQFKQPQPERLETFDPTLAGETRLRALYAIIASWIAILLYLWFRFGNWTFGLAAVLCLIHDLCFTIGAIAFCHYIHDTWFGKLLGLQDFKIDFAAIAALLTLVGYSVNEIIVNFARIREVRGKSPVLTPQMINDSVNQTLSRTVLTSTSVWLVVLVLYAFGGSGLHLFAFVMVVGVLVGTYSSIYVASPLLLLFGEGRAETKNGAITPAPAKS